MEGNTNVIFNFFDQALVERVIAFTELSVDEKTKENRLASELPHMRESREVIKPLIEQGLDESQIDENIKTILLGDGKGIW